MQSYLHSSEQVQWVSQRKGEEVVTESAEGEHLVRHAWRQARKGGLLSPYEAAAGPASTRRTTSASKVERDLGPRWRILSAAIVGRGGRRDGELGEGEEDWAGVPPMGLDKRGTVFVGSVMYLWVELLSRA